MQNQRHSSFSIILGSLLLATLALAQHPGIRTGPNPDLGVASLTAANYQANQVTNPPKTNRVWFDDIVVATEYIGPIHPHP